MSRPGGRPRPESRSHPGGGFEPAAYATDFGGPSVRTATPHPAYAELLTHVQQARRRRHGTLGDPAATRAAVLRLVDEAEPPLRVFLGDGPLATATAEYRTRLETWRSWEPLSVEAHGKR